MHNCISDTLCDSACSPEVYGPNFGIVGKNYDNSRLMFILHHSDFRALGNSQYKLPIDHPEARMNIDYSNALQKSDTGRVLNWILKSCRDLRRKTTYSHDLTWDDLFVTNFVKCLLKDDASNIEKVPRKEIYMACSNVLYKQIWIANPRKIVAFGDKTVSHMFSDISTEKLDSWNLTERLYEGIPVLLSPHPGHIHRQKDKQCKQYIKTIRDFIVS